MFTYGQAYVALSRVTSLEGLSMTGLSVTTIKAHPRVLEFYRKMTNSGLAKVKVRGFCTMTEEQRIEKEAKELADEEFGLDDLDDCALDDLEEEAIRELALSQEQRSQPSAAVEATVVTTPSPPAIEDDESLGSDGAVEWNTQEKLASVSVATDGAATTEEGDDSESLPTGDVPSVEGERVFIDLT